MIRLRNSFFVLVTLLMAVVTQADTLAIIGGTIIDGSGNKPIKKGVVIIENDKITAVGDRSTAIPEQARVIDAKGKYLIPGLMDANVHLFYEPVIESLARYEGRYEDIIIEAAQVALKNGVTTVFDSWGPRQPLVNVRNQINSAQSPGSRIFLAGNIAGLGGPLTEDFYFPDATRALISRRFLQRTNELWEQGIGGELLWLTPEQTRSKVRDYLNKDVDFFKYASSGHALNQLQAIYFPLKVQKIFVEEAHRAGVTAQSHTTSVATLELAIDAGVDLLQHCELTGPQRAPPELIKKMIDKNIACSINPLTKRRLKWLKEEVTHAGLRDLYLIADDNVNAMLDQGATLLMATDGGVMGKDMQTIPNYAGFLTSPDMLIELGRGHIVWFQAMHDKGMDPMEALMAATSHVARAYNIDDQLGTIEAGKIADLLVLNKNPLKNPKHYADIQHIIKAGKFVDADSLPIKKILTAD